MAGDEQGKTDTHLRFDAPYTRVFDQRPEW